MIWVCVKCGTTNNGGDYCIGCSDRKFKEFK